MRKEDGATTPGECEVYAEVLTHEELSIPLRDTARPVVSLKTCGLVGLALVVCTVRAKDGGVAAAAVAAAGFSFSASSASQASTDCGGGVSIPVTVAGLDALRSAFPPLVLLRRSAKKLLLVPLISTRVVVSSVFCIAHELPSYTFH